MSLAEVRGAPASTTALLAKSVALVALDRSADAIDDCDEVLARFPDAPEPALRQRVAWALALRRVAQAAVGRSADAVNVHDEALAGSHPLRDRRRISPGEAEVSFRQEPQQAAPIVHDDERSHA